MKPLLSVRQCLTGLAVVGLVCLMTGCESPKETPSPSPTAATSNTAPAGAGRPLSAEDRTYLKRYGRENMTR